MAYIAKFIPWIGMLAAAIFARDGRIVLVGVALGATVLNIAGLVVEFGKGATGLWAVILVASMAAIPLLFIVAVALAMVA